MLFALDSRFLPRAVASVRDVQHRQRDHEEGPNDAHGLYHAAATSAGGCARVRARANGRRSGECLGRPKATGAVRRVVSAAHSICGCSHALSQQRLSTALQTAQHSAHKAHNKRGGGSTSPTARMECDADTVTRAVAHVSATCCALASESAGSQTGRQRSSAAVVVSARTGRVAPVTRLRGAWRLFAA